MTPTLQQEAIYSAVESSTASLNVQAVAGAGKTSTSIEAAKRFRGGKVGFVAFNKHIAVELSGRLEGKANAMTLHSLGNACCKRAFSSVTLDENKPTKLLAKIRPGWTWCRKGNTVLKTEGRVVLNIARMAKMKMVDCQNPGPVVEIGGGTWWRPLASIVADYQIDLPADIDPMCIYRAAADLLQASKDQATSIDYNDMIWLPVVSNLPVEQFDLLLIDEAQDLNPCQRSLAFRACRNGRAAVVGDANQSIYSFMGADPNSIPEMVRELGKRTTCLDRPLTTTFRCPRTHVALANRIVPEIEARAGAPDGHVVEVEESDLIRQIRPGDMVIARRNAPLASLTLKLLSRGIKANMVGRDIGKGLLDLIDQFKQGDIYALIQSLEEYRAAETEKLERKDAPESAFLALADRVDSLRDLAATKPTVQSLRDFIAGLFIDQKPDKADVVTVSSIHKAKGLEADRVWIIDTRCLPMVLTCRRCKGRGCERCNDSGTRMNRVQIQQERNLLYVALTRSKSELFFAGGIPEVLRD